MYFPVRQDFKYFHFHEVLKIIVASFSEPRVSNLRNQKMNFDMILKCICKCDHSLWQPDKFKQDEPKKKVWKNHQRTLRTAIFSGSIVPAPNIIFDFEFLTLVFLESEELSKISAIYEAQVRISIQAYLSIFYTL